MIGVWDIWSLGFLEFGALRAGKRSTLLPFERAVTDSHLSMLR